MKKLSLNLSPRQLVLCCLAGALALSVCFLQWCILPAYDQWQQVKSQCEGLALTKGKLQRDLSQGPSIALQFSSLGERAYQSGSDEETLSQFLRDLETLVRPPALTLVNARPLPVENKGAYKLYKIGVSVAGKLPDIARFLAEMTAGGSVVGIESFTLRGVQGGDTVECGLAIWMVRLAPQGDSRATSSSAAQSKASHDKRV